MILTLRLMKWLAPAAALLALACALLAPAEAGSARRPRARAQNRNTQEEKPAEPRESVVRGRAVYDDTSRPVRRARVMLVTDATGRSEYAGLTDARGDFRIHGVPAGTYYAFVDAPGLLSPVGFVSIEEVRASGGTPDLGEGREFFDQVEVDGKQEVTVNVRARRGATIAGRVSYADGDPAVNVNLSLLRRSADGRVQKYLTGSNLPALSAMRTDDRGMFRLMGLPPGEYLIGVNEAVSHGGEGGASSGDEPPGGYRGLFAPQLLISFYPSATSVKEAGIVKVEAGEERTNLDITIPERDLRTIAGVVRSRSGSRPIANARISIVRRDDPLSPSGLWAAMLPPSESGSNGTITDSEGRWQFVEIPDGPYQLQVTPPEEYEETPSVANANANSSTYEYRPPKRKRSYAPTRRDLEVAGSDVSELVVELSEGARITGTVSVEGGTQPRYGHIAVMRLGEERGTADFVDSQYGPLDNGRFAIEGLSGGKFLIYPSIAGGDREGVTYLKSMTWNGKDIRREPLELAEGGVAEGVRIVYGRNPATLHVTVRSAAGKRLTGTFYVILVPIDLSTWTPYAQPFSCVAGDPGTCSISASPGEYRVLALGRLTQPGAYEQEVRRRALTAPRVTLREGETGRVEVDAPGDN